ncbi:MAG: M1 family aminopeptidase [Acidobacteriota bacterium]
MRRVLLAICVLALQGAPAAQTVPGRTQPPDGVVRLLRDLEGALQRGTIDDLRALASPTMPADDLDRLLRIIAAGPASGAIVRYRDHRPAGVGYEVLADALISRGKLGRIATWIVGTRPRGPTTDRYELTSLTEVAALDNLLRLALDNTKQFTVKDLNLELTDFTLKMPAGVAFVAESANGVTAVVVRGRGDIQFSPSDPAEQGQLRVFNGRPSLATEIDSAFLRLNPAQYAELVSEKSMIPGRVDPNEFKRADEIFADVAPRTYNLDLRELTPDRWSLEPTYGNLLVEFRSTRYGWLTYVNSPNDPDDISLFDRTRNRNISIYASPEKLKARGRFYTEDSDAAYDVERYNLDVTFEPARAWVTGRASLKIKIRSSSVGTLTFRLAQQLTVFSVSSPQFGYLLALRVSGQNNLLVSLPKPVDRGTVLDFEVNYSGRLEPQSIDREAIMPQAQQTRPQEPVDAPLLAPEARYLYSNRVFWYPQAPVTDYATATMRLTVPAEFQVVASGSPVRNSVAPAPATDGGRGVPPRSMRTVEFTANRPARYLSCIISRFIPVARTKVDIPVAPPIAGVPAGPNDSTTAVNVEVMSTPRVAGKNRALPARLAEMLRFYAKTIGDAPYPDFTVAALDDNLPGGHSPPFFAIWHQPLPTTPYSWSNDPVNFEPIFRDFFIAHETAHQWWGQAVGWKNYHEQWLSEGLAQYFAVLFAASDRGPDVARTLLVQMRASAEDLMSQGPISLGYRLGHVQNEGRIFRAIVYNKSAIVLHMLRRLMGDEAFFKGIRQFYSDWRFSKAGTDDFRALMETQTPLKLARFFDRWILGSTIPRIRVTPRIEGDGKSATVRIEQLGDVFDFPLTVVVQYADNTSEEITVPVTEANVDHKIALKSPARRVFARDELTFVEIVR